MLDTAAKNPALDVENRDAASALAEKFQRSAALITKGLSTPEEYLASIDEIDAKDKVMKKLCGEP